MTPDFDKLRDISAHLLDGKDAGTLTKERWEALRDEAREAAAGHGFLLRTVYVVGLELGFVAR